ncbi:sarcosine oxidase subunit gamma [Limibaculum sp. M0105]|uniref:Sarcosine oxidase subunit gamma n=1 Tax=Thermohalobaculum xanthum TaxID=2753746 RepID=A0A8J7SDC6_9RHOB|nr:sarcosine oxidase subunit gamma [Thermohalobaculum xanthum]MBK0399977.1 sarcosine oxidase subunit gamma [Thermohalobaculum xanthum]
MPERISSLARARAPRVVGPVGKDGPGIRLSERAVTSLWQISAWPDRLAAAGAAAARAADCKSAPEPGRSSAGKAATLMRVEPLKWWLVSDQELARPNLDLQDGTVLDLSHARTPIRIEGPAAVELMARLLPLDLRPAVFPQGAVASSGLHHVGVTVLARAEGFDLFAPQSFALSLFEHITHVAAQFGVEID